VQYLCAFIFIHCYIPCNFFFKADNSEDESNDSEEAGSDDNDATVGSMGSLDNR
jgi:hypothetical protein